MTQTEKQEFTAGQVVEIDGRGGQFFRVSRLPIEGDDTYTLFGGRSNRGGVRCWTVSARHDSLKAIKNKYTMRRAEATLRAIDDAMDKAPKAHYKKAGKK